MKFLKKLFQKKEETINISFNELSPWLVRNIEFSLDSEIQELKKAKIELEDSIKKLEETNTKGNAGKRIESAVNTNKKTYISALVAFHKKLDIPEKYNYSYLKEYSKEFNKKIKNLHQRTLRNYHIIKTLIGEELENVAVKLRTLDQTVKKMSNTLDSQKLKEIEEIHKKVKEIDDILIKNKEKNKIQEKLKQEKRKNQEDEEKISKGLNQLKNSKEFEDYEKLKQEKEKINETITSLNSDFRGLYLTIERSLRKLLKNDKKTINKLKEPQSFFLKEPEEFKKTLKLLKENIDNNKIVLKNPQKTVIQIDALVKYSEKYEKDYKEYNEKLKIKEEEFKTNKFKEKLLELTQKLQQKEKEITVINNTITENKEEKLDEAIKTIEKNLKKLGHNIQIKNVTLDRQI